jgi:hypothetical protein
MKQSSKNFLLIAGFFLVLLVAYQYSFSKTFEVMNELEELKIQVEQNSGSLQNIHSLKTKEVYLDSIISGNRVGNTSLQNNLLQVLNKHSEELSYKIISFKEPHIHSGENGQSKITSIQFVLEGQYKNLEEILYILEKDFSFGSLAHVKFERKRTIN